MEFSQTSSPFGGIIQGCERETKLGLGTISDNAAPDYYLAYFLGKINEAGDTIRQWIDEVNDEWTAQDTNDSGDNPEAKDFSDNTQKYTIDTDITKVRGVQAHDIISASKTVTITIATPGVFSLSDHGLILNDVVQFSTDDTLPTGLSADTDYYVITAGLTDDVFRVSTSEGGSAVNTSGSQAGTHKVIIEKVGWYDLKDYKEKDRIDDLYGQKSDSPIKYFMQGRSLITDVPVDTAKVDKYRITQDRLAHEFVIGDTDAEPGINKQFHWLYVYLPTMAWAENKNPQIFQAMNLKIYGQGENDPRALKTMLQDHYLNQGKDIIPMVEREAKTYD